MSTERAIEAAFFDIDGTLVSFKTHTVPPSTLRALAQLRARGVKVFISTGRPPIYLKVIEGIPFDGYVTTNGSYCYTPQGETIYDNPIPQEDVERLAAWPRLASVPMQVIHRDGTFVTQITPVVEQVGRLLSVEAPPVAPIAQAMGKRVYQMLAFLSEEEQAELLDEVLVHCSEMRWCPLFTDLIHRDNSKSHGIDQMLRYHGIPLGRTISFGDGGNDIAMLRHTAIGVAMGNADERVRAAADYVTSSVDDDGIYRALLHFGLL